MPGPNLIQSQGGQTQKPTKFTSIFTSRFFLGYYTNRSLLRGPLGLIYSDFYHAGTTDVLCDGLNSELFEQLTMVRRPGCPDWSFQIVSGTPDDFYSFHRTDGAIQVIVDSDIQIEWITPFGAQILANKSAGAGQGYFASALNTLYMADGVDLLQYIPTGNTDPNTGNQTWNWGGPAPTVAPTITVIASGYGDPAWNASTYYSTMGMINVQPTGAGQKYLFQLTSINASPVLNPNSSTTIGTSGAGTPAFSTTPGGHFTDNTVIWQCSATPITLWQPKTFYPEFAVIWDPGTNGVYYLERTAGAYSQSNGYPNFQHGSINAITWENVAFNGSQAKWRFLGGPSTLLTWQPSHAYSDAFPFGNLSTLNKTDAMIVEPTFPTQAILNAGAPLIYVQFVYQAGTSSASFTLPNFPTQTGFSVIDGQLAWTCIGPSAYPASGTPLTPWTPGAKTFSACVDANNNLEVCIVAGVATSAGAAGFGNNYSDQSQDGKWVNCGSMANAGWLASSLYYLPLAGFAPPQSAVKYGGAAILDSNNNQQVAISSGFSGNAHPAWATTINTQTTDNTGGGTDVGVTWQENGALQTNSLTWQSGHAYVYCWGSRTASDVYSAGTTVPAGSRQYTPLPWQLSGQPAYLPYPSGALTGDFTTASPIAILNTPNTLGGIIQVSGPGTTDPQYDTVYVFRTVDGGQNGTTFLLVSLLPMPTPVSGNAGTWTLNDYMPDLATSTLAGLNTLVVAPIAHANDPPPGQTGSLITSGGLKGICYHQGRIWGFVGSTVYASGGPDTNPGNGFDAWPPDNDFPFQSSVVQLLPTATGLLVFTTTDLYFIGGGPSIGAYYSQLFVPEIGISSPNAVTIYKGLPIAFTSDRQLLKIDPSAGGIVRIGHAIGDKLNLLDPSQVYVVYHTYGEFEDAIFIGDGATGWYRCTPTLAPDHDITGPVWSPFTAVTGGAKAMASVTTKPGTRQLLIGATTAGQVPLYRDSSFGYFQDGGNNAVNDYFVRANENPLSDGGNWTAQLSLATIQLLNRVARPAFTSVPCYAFWTGSTWQADQSATITISALFQSNPVIGLILRASTTQQTWYQLNINGPAGSPAACTIVKYINGAATTLATFSATPNVNDYWTFGVYADMLCVYQNGVFLQTVRDASIASGIPAIMLQNATGTNDTAISRFTGTGTNVIVQGTPYESYFTMGNIVLCSAGQMAEMAFINMDFVQTGSQPTISILFDELGPTSQVPFEVISNYMVSDPPKLYGPTGTPATLWSNRYYFGQTTPGNPSQVPNAAWCKWFQLKCDFGTDTVMNQCLGMTVFGALYQEK